MSRTFVTGFGPFRNIEENPSSVLAAHAGVPHQVLEVSYQAVDHFISTFDVLGYDNLLLMGVASGRPRVSLELVAKNLRSGEDVDGVSRDGLIELEGPGEIQSTLWSHELVEFMKVDFPESVELSWDAGSYLCNYLYYQALRNISVPRIGFLHVAEFEKVGLPTQQEIVRAVMEELTGS